MSQVVYFKAKGLASKSTLEQLDAKIASWKRWQLFFVLIVFGVFLLYFFGEVLGPTVYSKTVHSMMIFGWAISLFAVLIIGRRIDLLELARHFKKQDAESLSGMPQLTPQEQVQKLADEHSNYDLLLKRGEITDRQECIMRQLLIFFAAFVTLLVLEAYFLWHGSDPICAKFALLCGMFLPWCLFVIRLIWKRFESLSAQVDIYRKTLRIQFGRMGCFEESADIKR